MRDGTSAPNLAENFSGNTASISLGGGPPTTPITKVCGGRRRRIGIGWGINFAHQGDTIFASWFTYDTNGRGWWLVMTALKTAPNTYSGKLYQTRGPAFNAVTFDPTAVVATEAGTGTITFTDANNGTFAYVIGRTSEQGHHPPDLRHASDVHVWRGDRISRSPPTIQDLWWKKPGGSESGWGINLTHQGDTIFASWFTYDLDGTPLWLVVTAQKTGAGVYSGDLYRTSGPRFDAFRPANDLGQGRHGDVHVRGRQQRVVRLHGAARRDGGAGDANESDHARDLHRAGDHLPVIRG